MSAALQKTLFNLKFTAKSLERESKKCEKNEKAQKKKVATAIKKGNMEGAAIYASNAIREKNQALNYLKLSSRIDAVAARVNTAMRTQQLTKSMGSVVKGMDKVLASMNVEKIAGVMEKFEKQFDDIDVRTGYMEGAMDSTTAQTTPPDQVSALISEVADAQGLELMEELPAAATGAPVATAAPATSEADSLEARLAKLRGI
eukprot:TRINITY_DN781973_c0_g1_i1.p1 TRINITY_DN781973_c0_g1~~TRINITY_DN781973_c0_g1_i1.p1  ORF type:complete len:202 (-),score=89.72 TRINITY_DN781973_c0_g1_i1:184-789(-)